MRAPSVGSTGSGSRRCRRHHSQTTLRETGRSQHHNQCSPARHPTSGRAPSPNRRKIHLVIDLKQARRKTSAHRQRARATECLKRDGSGRAARGCWGCRQPRGRSGPHRFLRSRFRERSRSPAEREQRVRRGKCKHRSVVTQSTTQPLVPNPGGTRSFDLRPANRTPSASSRPASP